MAGESDINSQGKRGWECLVVVGASSYWVLRTKRGVPVNGEGWGCKVGPARWNLQVRSLELREFWVFHDGRQEDGSVKWKTTESKSTLGTQAWVKRLSQGSQLNLLEKVWKTGEHRTEQASEKAHLVLSESQMNNVWKRIAFRGKEENWESLMV